MKTFSFYFYTKKSIRWTFMMKRSCGCGDGLECKVAGFGSRIPHFYRPNRRTRKCVVVEGSGGSAEGSVLI